MQALFYTKVIGEGGCLGWMSLLIFHPKPDRLTPLVTRMTEDKYGVRLAGQAPSVQ